MTEVDKKPTIEIEQIVLEELPVEQKQIPSTLKETNQVKKVQLLKKWKESEGYFYLKPRKFEFSLKNL
jgi:hypothetical protein